MARTKWEVLIDRLKEKEAEAAALRAELRHLLKTHTRGHDGGPIVCTGCGTSLRTEADFAHHYVVPDERYLNLGRCPTTNDHHTPLPSIPAPPAIYTAPVVSVLALLERLEDTDPDLIRGAVPMALQLQLRDRVAAQNQEDND